MRKKIVAGNWKMNKVDGEVKTFLSAIKQLSYPSDVDLVVVPPAVFIKEVTNVLEPKKIYTGAQNCSEYEEGAYTGELAAKMIRSVGAQYVIVGHSERRAYFGEKNEVLALKIDQALANNLTPIYCCGEKLEEREAGNHFKIVEKQIEEGLFHLPIEEITQCVIAYEPVWAIGTGVTATPEQAQEMHVFIRNLIVKKYNQQIAEKIAILYGGSCNPDNAKELFANLDIDGGLIGGASLKPEEFIAIANSFS
ncbi:MAG: triose-phosphate isomerase [Vicingus serpentipes]|nr:triose-phosphate isomerase [Vicingus serpentipes]